jgi:hypothetical protein
MIQFEAGVVRCQMKVLDIFVEDEDDATEDDYKWMRLSFDLGSVSAVQEDYDTECCVISIGGSECVINVSFDEFEPFWVANRYNVFLLKNN